MSPASADRYAGAARGWADGAVAVYRPIAAELVALAPHALAGRTVLDVGAGTGVGSEALVAAGAHPVATDASVDMLAWQRTARPPAVAADVVHLPLGDAAVDDAFASFVLNHLARPVAGLRELARVVRPGGAVLATVYSSASRSAVRDRIDALAAEHGWVPPDWYVQMKAEIVPLLGDADRMRAAAVEAGLQALVVEERAVDVGITDPAALVDYRFGQAQFASWVAAQSPEADRAVRRATVEDIAPAMEPYRPIVVFLAAVVA